MICYIHVFHAKYLRLLSENLKTKFQRTPMIVHNFKDMKQNFFFLESSHFMTTAWAFDYLRNYVNNFKLLKQ